MNANSSNPGMDGRAAPRFKVRWPVELEDGSGRTRDISATGMYLECDIRVTPGTLLKFAVMLPRHRGIAEKLECLGRVVRQERHGAGGFGIGVELQGFHFTGVGV